MGARSAAPAVRSSPAPAARSAAAPATTQSGGGFLGSVMHGMASGVGFSMASRAVDAVVGPRSMEVRHVGDADASGQQPQQQQRTPGVCQLQQEQVNQCLSHASDMTYCQNYFEALKQCQQESARM